MFLEKVRVSFGVFNKYCANNIILKFFSGCESETDTEEFEKVGQSPVDRRKLVDGRSVAILPKPESTEIATSTEHIETATTETLTEVC